MGADMTETEKLLRECRVKFIDRSESHECRLPTNLIKRIDAALSASAPDTALIDKIAEKYFPSTIERRTDTFYCKAALTEYAQRSAGQGACVPREPIIGAVPVAAAPTPRTDAQRYITSEVSPNEPREVVDADFAEQLETELAAAKSQVIWVHDIDGPPVYKQGNESLHELMSVVTAAEVQHFVNRYMENWYDLQEANAEIERVCALHKGLMKIADERVEAAEVALAKVNR